MSKMYHMTEIRPSKENIDKMEKLQQFLRDNNMALIHGDHHVKVVIRTNSEKIISQFSVL